MMIGSKSRERRAESVSVMTFQCGGCTYITVVRTSRRMSKDPETEQKSKLNLEELDDN
jgi:hypothetical protein